MTMTPVFITGANRGLGAALVRAFLAAGAPRVYAGVRDAAVTVPTGAIPVVLDVTQPRLVQAAAARCADTGVVVNNAAISRGSPLLASAANEAARAEFETNVLGILNVSAAFAPVLARNGGGALINILSVLSWLPAPPAATYAASKSAAWSVTNGLREELRAQGTLVIGVHAGYIDTDLSRRVTAPKASPDDVANAIIEALHARREEALVDDLSRTVKAGLSEDRPMYLGRHS